MCRTMCLHDTFYNPRFAARPPGLRAIAGPRATIPRLCGVGQARKLARRPIFRGAAGDFVGSAACRRRRAASTWLGLIARRTWLGLIARRTCLGLIARGVHGQDARRGCIGLHARQDAVLCQRGKMRFCVSAARCGFVSRFCVTCLSPRVPCFPGGGCRSGSRARVMTHSHTPCTRWEGHRRRHGWPSLPALPVSAVGHPHAPARTPLPFLARFESSSATCLPHFSHMPAARHHT